MKVTESIYSKNGITIPMADVQHIEERGQPPSLVVVMKSTRYDFANDEWGNPAAIPASDANDFMTSWCRYRSELESDTLMDLTPAPADQ